MRCAQRHCLMLNALYINKLVKWNHSIHFQFLDSSAGDPILNLMQRVNPTLAVVPIFVVPLQAGAVEHLAVALQPSLRQRADVLDELVFSHPPLRIRRHRLPNRRHNLRS